MKYVELGLYHVSKDFLLNNSISFDPKIPITPSLINFFLKNDFIPTFSNEIVSEYYLSIVDNTQSTLVTNISLLQEFPYFVTYAVISNFNMGSHNRLLFDQYYFVKLFNVIARSCFLYFIIIFTCRVYYIIFPTLSIKVKNLKFSYLFLKDGKVLLRYRPIYFSNFLSYIKELKKNIHIAIKNNKDVFFVFDNINSAYNVNIFHLPQNYLFITIVHEKSETPLYCSAIKRASKNCTVVMDDSLESQVSQAEFTFKKSSCIEVNIPFQVYDDKCNISLSTKPSVVYPISTLSNLISHISSLHIDIINKGILIQATFNEMSQYIDELFYRLNLAGIIIYRGGKQVLFKTALSDASNDSLTQDISQFLLKISEIRSASEIVIENKKKYRLTGNHFMTGSSDFILIIVFYSKLMVLRSVERAFHMYLSLFLSSHVSLLPSDDTLLLWKRLESIFEQAQVLSLVSCKGESTQIYDSIGKIFGREVNQSLFDLIISQTNNKYVREKGKQNIVDIEYNGSIYQILLDYRTYFDETLMYESTVYFIEDVSKFFPSKHMPDNLTEDLNFISKSFGFVRLNENHELENAELITKSLGYKEPISKIDDILYSEDKNCFHKKNKSKFSFRLLSPFGHPSWFTAIPIQNNSYFIFSFFEMRKNRVLSPAETDFVVVDHSTKNIIFGIIDSDLVYINLFISNEWLSPLCDKINNTIPLNTLLSFLDSEDYNLFLSSIHNLESGKSCEEDFYIKIYKETDGESKDSSSYSNYRVCMFLTSEQTVSIFLNDVSKKIKKQKEQDKLLEFMDFAFSNTNTLQYTFDDTTIPDRCYKAFPISRTSVIFNWSNVTQQCPLEYQNEIRRKIRESIDNKAVLDTFFPLKFDRKIVLYICGAVIDNNLTGLAFDFTSIHNEIIELKEELNKLEIEEEARKREKVEKLKFRNDVKSINDNFKNVYHFIFQDDDLIELIEFVLHQFDQLLI